MAQNQTFDQIYQETLDDLQKLYDEYKRVESGQHPDIPKPDLPPAEIAPEVGASGLHYYVVKDIATTAGENPGHATDGKKSTFFEGNNLIADLGGIAEVKGIALRIKDGPSQFQIEISAEGTVWGKLPILGYSNNANEFEFFEFASPPVPCSKVRITAVGEETATIKISSMELTSEVMEEPEIPEPEPPKPTEPGTEQPPTTQPPSGDMDQFGIKKIAPDKPGGKVWTDMSYKFSEHNTGTRDTFSKKIGDVQALEMTGYYKASLSDSSEELSNKFLGGNHTGSGSSNTTKQGRCYSVGVEQQGAVSMKKEYPQHPDTPDFSDEPKIASGMPSKLKSLKDRWIGLKVLTWNDGKNVYMQCYVDDDGMISDKPANNWKKWYEITDSALPKKSRSCIWRRWPVLYAH
jgi:hypothetical protein